ncbi:MAG: lytic transglycosylase domain-containing protein [Chitinophagaceae bacterium]|nr:lytic transglycosylase domain-containing protein [Chitinophagaceae bacterium]
MFSNYSYNPTQPYAVQINANASNFIETYVKSHGSYLNEMKGWGKPYFNLMESILQQYGLPKELKYIAVIESNLKTGAVSCKGAGGPWQFMPATARAMGLKINSYTDERTDYYKSTHAACKYLLQLYKQLDDWLLVMAAYNGGPGRVLSAIKKSGSRSFWDLQYNLPEESRTYVKRFIATHYIMEGNNGNNGEWAMEMSAPVNASLTSMDMNASNSYANPYDIKRNINEDELNLLETQSISGKYNSLVIAKNLGIDIQQFNRLNPSFDHMIINNGNYDLRLPEDKMQAFLANKYQILNECVQILLNNDGVINTSLDNKTYYNKKYSKQKKSRA